MRASLTVFTLCDWASVAQLVGCISISISIYIHIYVSKDVYLMINHHFDTNIRMRPV